MGELILIENFKSMRELDLIEFDDPKGFWFVEVKNMVDWALALRVLIKQFELDAPKGIPHRGRAMYVKINEGYVKVDPTFPTDGLVNKVSGIRTYDATNGSHSLATLVATKRISSPGAILSSLNGRVSSDLDKDKQHNADIAAVEHGISEQAYGGRTAIIATMMVHRYGQSLIDNKIERKITEIGDHGEIKAVSLPAYHTVYLGTGKGSAATLAAHQNYTQKVKIGELLDAEVPVPSITAAQLEAIYIDLIALPGLKGNKKLQSKILNTVMKEANDAIDLLYTGDDTAGDKKVVTNLKRNLTATLTHIIKKEKLPPVEKVIFDKASTSKGATEFKTRGRSRSDVGDEVAKGKGKDKGEEKFLLKTKNGKRKMESTAPAKKRRTTP